jgi:hypothetical protein
MRRRWGAVYALVAALTCASCALTSEMPGGPIIVAARVAADTKFEIHLICISRALAASQNLTTVSLVITPGHSPQIRRRRARLITKEQTLLLRDPNQVRTVQRGMLFAPIHWSEETASAARVDLRRHRGRCEFRRRRRRATQGRHPLRLVHSGIEAADRTGRCRRRRSRARAASVDGRGQLDICRVKLGSMPPLVF